MNACLFSSNIAKWKYWEMEQNALFRKFSSKIKHNNTIRAQLGHIFWIFVNKYDFDKNQKKKKLLVKMENDTLLHNDCENIRISSQCKK